MTYPYTFAWGNNPTRAGLKGRRCRILSSGQEFSVLVEFEGGERHVVSRRALRRVLRPEPPPVRPSAGDQDEGFTRAEVREGQRRPRKDLERSEGSEEQGR